MPANPIQHIFLSLPIFPHKQALADPNPRVQGVTLHCECVSLGAPVTAWRSHIAVDGLNTRILTALLPQHLADMLGQDAAFAVMPEHSRNSYNTHCNDRKIDILKRATLVHEILCGIHW